MNKLLCVILLFSSQVLQVTQPSIIETNQPYSYEVLQQDLAKIRLKYRKEVKIKKLGKTHFGRYIYAAKLGKGKKNIVIIGAHHGREWMTSMLLMKQLEMYAQAYHNKIHYGSIPSDILNEVSIWFVPMLNPDGVAIQQNRVHLFPTKHQERLLIMNEGVNHFERWKANGVGIDLNRQYPAGWKRLNNEPNAPYYQFYKGKKPFEAMEVKALRKFIRDKNPAIAVSYHSAGREVFWNYCNGSHTRRDKKVAQKIARLTGYKLTRPPKQSIGGGFTDWFITKYHRPAMTIEISPLVGETSPPLTLFEEEWNRNKYVGLTLAQEAKEIND